MDPVAVILTPILAFVRAAILFWPTMLMLGVVHSIPGFDWVPALGWDQTFLVIVLISLLFGGLGSGISSKD